MNTLHVKKGDTIMVLSGKSKGKKGKVLDVSIAEGKVIVEGVNMVTKHVKPRKAGQEGGILKAESPLYACKVVLYCQKCDKGVRHGTNVLENGEKVRLCKSCGNEL